VLEEIRDFYAYNRWANERLLDRAERLDRDQYVAVDDGIESIRDTLVHTLDAQWIWLQRWLGISPREYLDVASFPDVATLRSRWNEIERKSEEYLAALQEADVVRPFAYVNSKGEGWSYPLWQQLLHQVNHATQHRSEAALRLTRLGQSPGNMDYLIYHDDLGGTRVTERPDGDS
jgi:uncharacterized damage-inducible protein DinB